MVPMQIMGYAAHLRFTSPLEHSYQSRERPANTRSLQVAALEHRTMSDIDKVSSEEDMELDTKTPGAPGAVVVAEDPAAPSREVSSKRQSLSDLFTIVGACFPLYSAS